MPSRNRDFWTERTVAWYRRALARSDYAARVLAALEPALAGCRTALDVGAGAGALTVPLARWLRHVTALEPAPAMAKALADEARIQGLRNIEVIEAAWGAVPVRPHDLVLCAHVGELLRPGSTFLREVGTAARRAVALVCDAGGDPDKFFFGELYPVLLGRPYGGGGAHEETVERLAALSASPTVSFVEYRSDQPFASLEEAGEFWEAYLGLDGPEAPGAPGAPGPAAARTFLQGFLAERLAREPGGGFIAPYRKRAAVIWWRLEPERR
jgi:hypothetical protein